MSSIVYRALEGVKEAIAAADPGVGRAARYAAASGGSVHMGGGTTRPTEGLYRGTIL